MIRVIHQRIPSGILAAAVTKLMNEVPPFEDLPLWKDSADLARRMYEFSSSSQFNRHPGLRDQLERGAVSVEQHRQRI